MWPVYRHQLIRKASKKMTEKLTQMCRNLSKQKMIQHQVRTSDLRIKPHQCLRKLGFATQSAHKDHMRFEKLTKLDKYTSLNFKSKRYLDGTLWHGIPSIQCFLGFSKSGQILLKSRDSLVGKRYCRGNMWYVVCRSRVCS